ncbi:MAG: hypothetical protein V4515_00070 [Chloroflexota bacterium]
MLDLSQILALICGPYGPLVGIGLALAYRLARQRWPNLPALPFPSPKPADPSAPVLPIPAPAGNDFPILRRLLKGLGVPIPADLRTLPADQLAALWTEVDTLAGKAAEHREAEAAVLK